jgi:hypothetical protein
MILHRYLRYTPLLAALLLFLITLMKHIVFAPNSYLDDIVPNCEKWWWTTLLHVQNYVNPTEIVRIFFLFKLSTSNYFYASACPIPGTSASTSSSSSSHHF